MATTPHISVAAAVAAAVKQAGTNPVALEEATGIPRTTLRRSLDGRRPFKVDELYAIAETLGVDVRTFLVSDAA